MTCWLLIYTSCWDCNRELYKLFSKRPSEEEVREQADAIGGMTCLRARVIEVDGPAVEQAIEE
jgi:hypothetical protein